MSQNKPPIFFQLGIGAFLLICFHFVLISVLRSAAPIVSLKNGELHMSDFAYHIMLVRDFWFGSTANIYRYPDQLALVQKTFGADIVHAMPVGVSPAALLLWFPFAALSRVSMEHACAAWSAFSLAVLVTGFLRVFAEKDWLFSGQRLLLFVSAIIITLFSYTGVTAIFLGQTSILAAGALLLFFVVCSSSDKPVSALWIVCLLLACSLKLPYLIAAVGILTAQRRYSELRVFIGCGVLLAFAVFLLVGTDSISEYLATQHLYAWGEMPDYYRDAVVPQTVNTLGTALLPSLGWQTARGVASAASGICYVLLFAASLRTRRTRGTAASAPILSCLFIAVFLCLAPYAGAYEDLLFLPAFAFAFHALELDTRLLARKIPFIGCIFFIVLYFVLMNYNAGVGRMPAPLLWLLKLLPFLLVFRTARLRPPEAE